MLDYQVVEGQSFLNMKGTILVAIWESGVKRKTRQKENIICRVGEVAAIASLTPGLCTLYKSPSLWISCAFQAVDYMHIKKKIQIFKFGQSEPLKQQLPSLPFSLLFLEWKTLDHLTMQEEHLLRRTVVKWNHYIYIFSQAWTSNFSLWLLIWHFHLEI